MGRVHCAKSTAVAGELLGLILINDSSWLISAWNASISPTGATFGGGAFALSVAVQSISSHGDAWFVDRGAHILVASVFLTQFYTTGRLY